MITGSYPISRWYLRPAAGWLAAALAATPIRPVQLTCCGLAAAGAAAGLMLRRPDLMPLAAALVLVYWFFDRADGQLARRQQTTSAFGAWFDANVDEAVDVGLHVAVAVVLARQTADVWPWWMLAAFLGGKYLLMYGLMVDDGAKAERPRGASAAASRTWMRDVYHFPGNADVRVHLLVLALATGWLAAELTVVAVYYNVRWIARYVLVARRLGGVP